MTARHELDRLCHESWIRLGHDLKSTSNSMGRVGLSCARRHPALLLGGGALLGFGAMLWLTRGKRHAKRAHDHDHVDGHDQRGEVRDRESSQPITRKQPKPSKIAPFAAGALATILKSAARMWLVQHLSSEVSAEKEDGVDSHDDVHAQSST